MGSVIEGADFQQPAASITTGANAADVVEQGKRQVKKLGGVTRSSLLQQADSKKGQLAGMIRGLADSLEQAGLSSTELQPVVGRASGVVKQVASTLEDQSTEELLQSAQAQFRARPGAFLAGLFALGFIAGRIIRE